LDNDAVFAMSDTLAGLLAALDRTPNLGAVACRIVNDSTGQDDLTSWGYPRSLLPHAAERFMTTTFVGAGHAIRRDAWDAAGGYDPALFFCWEEFDFCLRAIALGWRVQYRGDLVVRHKVSAERRVGWSGERWFYFVRNRVFIARKYGASWVALLPRMAGYLLKGVLNGLGVKTIRALAAAARMSRDARRHPPPAQALAYLGHHDTAHRGSLVRRLRTEIAVRLGSEPAL
jgi:GT2 family glycosyltransferase